MVLLPVPAPASTHIAREAVVPSASSQASTLSQLHGVSLLRRVSWSVSTWWASNVQQFQQGEDCSVVGLVV